MSQKNNVNTAAVRDCVNERIRENKATETTEAQAILEDAREECRETINRRETTFSEPVCINANQIYDSCRDRDCVKDSRVYLTREGQELVDRAINVKLKSAEIIWVFTDVEPLSFNRGYFSVDLKFFVCTTLEVFTSVSNPTIIHGLSTFDKRVILFGSEGNSKIFSSKFNPSCGSEIAESWHKTNMPTVTVEVVEPVALSARIEDEDCEDNGCCDCDCDCEHRCKDHHKECHEDSDYFPDNISSCFSDKLVVDDCSRHVLVTYGLFFIVRLERDTQLLIDAVDFCIPTQECPSATEDSPCALFNNIRFPIDEFFPPQKERSKRDSCDCKKHK